MTALKRPSGIEFDYNETLDCIQFTYISHICAKCDQTDQATTPPIPIGDTGALRAILQDPTGSGERVRSENMQWSQMVVEKVQFGI